MKKIKFLVALVATLLLCSALSSCLFGEVKDLSGDGFHGYYFEVSEGISSITNYDPTKLGSLPKYQELVQYGDGAGLDNEGVVYFVYVVDTTVDPESPAAYYCAELDGETRELLTEEGEYFADEAEKTALIEKLVDMMDKVK